MLDEVAVLHVHPGDTATATLLLAVGDKRQRLDVAGLRNRDHHLLIGDQILNVDLVLTGRDQRAPLIGKAIVDLGQLLLDQAQNGSLAAEQLAQFADPFDHIVVLALDRVGLKRRQLRQPQVKNRARLDRRQVEAGDQLLTRRVAVCRRADQLDHGVKIVERDQQPEQDVRAGLFDSQLVLGAAHDNLTLMSNVGGQ